MPVIQLPNTVLVTGSLLCEYLKNYFASYSSKFEVTAVEDIRNFRECAQMWRIMYTTGGAVRFETNIHATEIFKEQGDKTHAITTYHASKTLTEQSTWKSVKNHADETNWDLTSVKLPFILGVM